MNKQQFEATDGGIRKGDLIIVTMNNNFTYRVHMYAGRYNPIEDKDHSYVRYASRVSSDI